MPTVAGFATFGRMPHADDRTRQQLVDLASALYGPHWLAPLARELGIAERTVSRWVQGQARIAPGAMADLVALARSRSNALLTALASLDHE